MSVLPISSGTVLAPLLAENTTSTSLNTKSYSSHGPLSQQQLNTLRAVAGYDFNWPPAPGSGPFPLAAVYLADRVNLSNPLTAQQPLTVDSLKAMAAAGWIDAAGLARGTAFLRGESTANGRYSDSAVSRPVAGTVASDGSVYL